MGEGGRAASADGTVPRWELFEHGADVGVRGVGPTLAAAFAQAAQALVAVVVDPAGVQASVAVDLHAEAPDAELLLVDWLNAVIYAMATRGMVFARFDVAIDEARLDARAFGEPLDRARHAPVVEPKGATYTALSVHRRDDGAWVAQCVVDV